MSTGAKCYPKKGEEKQAKADFEERGVVLHRVIREELSEMVLFFVKVCLVI